MRNEEEIKLKITSTLHACGVDEAGAGCYASDLLVASCILDPEKLHRLKGLTDSKKLTEKKREELYPQIIESALDYCIVHVSPEEIDNINILQARMVGMKRAIEGLKKVDYAVIDGNRIPKGLVVETDYLVKADLLIACVSAASILAKVTRDRLMLEQAKIYPQYGFESHKGYGTKAHQLALEAHGACDIHRKSYAPVKLHPKR
jgi:ribonuclease HII